MSPFQFRTFSKVNHLRKLSLAVLLLGFCIIFVVHTPHSERAVGVSNQTECRRHHIGIQQNLFEVLHALWYSYSALLDVLHAHQPISLFVGLWTRDINPITAPPENCLVQIYVFNCLSPHLRAYFYAMCQVKKQKSRVYIDWKEKAAYGLGRSW